MNPDLDFFDKSLQKPEKGTALMERHSADLARKQQERDVADAVRKRDGRCRWPEAHKCLGGPLEAAHIVDKSLRGETATENVVLLCPFIHRRGPESIHGKQLRVEKETPEGANSILSFWRQLGEFDPLGQPVYYLVARERAIGILERD
jgi:hypothetical protein